MNKVTLGLFFIISNEFIFSKFFFEFHAWVKKCHLAIFQKLADWLDWSSPVSAAFHFPSQFFFLFSISIPVPVPVPIPIPIIF